MKSVVLTGIERVFFGGRKGLDNADEALRYLPISDHILKECGPAPKILEVGSGIKGITPYLPFKITGVDVAFNGAVAENLEAVCLSGTSLPFADRSYDCVLSVDMLEHVPQNERAGVISELLRVASKRVYLAVPCGQHAEEHDKFLDRLFQEVKGERYHFFEDHVDNGLPSREEVESGIRAAADRLGIKVKVTVRGNVNLQVRALFMRLWIAAPIPKMYAWVSPFLCIARRLLNFGRCYRQIFIVQYVD